MGASQSNTANESNPSNELKETSSLTLDEATAQQDELMQAFVAQHSDSDDDDEETFSTQTTLDAPPITTSSSASSNSTEQKKKTSPQKTAPSQEIALARFKEFLTTPYKSAQKIALELELIGKIKKTNYFKDCGKELKTFIPNAIEKIGITVILNIFFDQYEQVKGSPSDLAVLIGKYALCASLLLPEDLFAYWKNTLLTTSDLSSFSKGLTMLNEQYSQLLLSMSFAEFITLLALEISCLPDLDTQPKWIDQVRIHLQKLHFLRSNNWLDESLIHSDQITALVNTFSERLLSSSCSLNNLHQELETIATLPRPTLPIALLLPHIRATLELSDPSSRLTQARLCLFFLKEQHLSTEALREHEEIQRLINQFAEDLLLQKPLETCAQELQTFSMLSKPDSKLFLCFFSSQFAHAQQNIQTLFTDIETHFASFFSFDEFVQSAMDNLIRNLSTGGIPTDEQGKTVLYEKFVLLVSKKSELGLTQLYVRELETEMEETSATEASLVDIGTVNKFIEQHNRKVAEAHRQEGMRAAREAFRERGLQDIFHPPGTQGIPSRVPSRSGQ